jgi:CRISPR-associated protein Cas6
VYWEEGKQEQVLSVPDDVVDISYRIQCRALPVDHAEALAEALLTRLEWLASDPQAGVHSIHVADSGNGWMRPDSPDDLIYPSRRTRLTLRVPQAHLDDALELPGTILDVAGNSLSVGEASVRPLSTLTTLFARYVAADDGGDENAFLESMATELAALDIRPRKMMCGISKTIRYGDAKILTRSLMLADKDIKQVRAGASAGTE